MTAGDAEDFARVLKVLRLRTANTSSRQNDNVPVGALPPVLEGVLGNELKVLCARCNQWLSSEDKLVRLTRSNSVWMKNGSAFCGSRCREALGEFGVFDDDDRPLPLECTFCGQEHDWPMFIELRASDSLCRADYANADKNSKRKRLRVEYLKRIISELARASVMFAKAGLFDEILREEIVSAVNELRKFQ